MPKTYLPLKVDPFRFADNATQLHGSISVKDMQRLCTSLFSDEGDIDVHLAFGVDEQGIRFMRGHLKTCLKLQCQRCMEPLDYDVIGDFVSGILTSEEEVDGLPERYEPLVVKDATLYIQDVIEDELILDLPLVPMHDLKECKVKLPLMTDSELEMEKESPFKVIELLRSKRNTE